MSDQPHYHRDERGLLVKCYHTGRDAVTSFWQAVSSPQWWIAYFIGATTSFPVEHFLWEKVWPFKIISEWMGL